MSTVRLRWGGVTDVGRHREANEDSMLIGPDVFVVADGMGGHAAGEIASRLTVETIDADLPRGEVSTIPAAPSRGRASDDLDGGPDTEQNVPIVSGLDDDEEDEAARSVPSTDERIADPADPTNTGKTSAPVVTQPVGAVPVTRVEHLITAVQAANEVVWNRSHDDPALSGMGTTVVAIGVVVEDGEERIAIVNVGDSRAYLLSRNELTQVSRDHSHVGDLVREGRITPDEARTHPQKNLVTRAIGIEEFVEVDDFQILPATGDRYLLCSDGLTDEVTDDEIARVLRTVADPNEAAQALVDLANEHGGRDNITIAVVDVLDDGLDPAAVAANAAAAQRAAIPDDDRFHHDPNEDTATLGALPDVGPEAMGRIPRAITLRSLIFVLAVMVLVASGAFLFSKSVRDTYYVGVSEDGQQVAIFQGRPGGFLWFHPTLTEATDLAFADLPQDAQLDVTDGVVQSTLAGALRYVANLENRVDDLTAPVTTPSDPCADAPATSTTATDTPATEPRLSPCPTTTRPGPTTTTTTPSTTTSTTPRSQPNP